MSEPGRVLTRQEVEAIRGRFVGREVQALARSYERIWEIVWAYREEFGHIIDTRGIHREQGCPGCMLDAALSADEDYSPEYQDEYQRLWHEAAADRDRLKARVAVQEGQVQEWEAQATLERDLRLSAETRVAELEKVRADREQLREALKALHEEVEMAESIGICLPDRVPSLNAGAVLSASEETP